jgi:hypothetical protein
LVNENEFENLSQRLASHGLPVVEIPLQDELTVAVDVHMPRGMVPSPGDEDVASTTQLRDV